MSDQTPPDFDRDAFRGWSATVERSLAAELAAAEERGYRRAITDLRDVLRYRAWLVNVRQYRGVLDPSDREMCADYLTHLAAKAGVKDLLDAIATHHEDDKRLGADQ